MISLQVARESVLSRVQKIAEKTKSCFKNGKFYMADGKDELELYHAVHNMDYQGFLLFL